jgi:hypothetical protein
MSSLFLEGGIRILAVRNLLIPNHQLNVNCGSFAKLNRQLMKAQRLVAVVLGVCLGSVSFGQGQDSPTSQKPSDVVAVTFGEDGKSSMKSVA